MSPLRLHRFKAPCTLSGYESLPLVPVCAQAENTPDKKLMILGDGKVKASHNEWISIALQVQAPGKEGHLDENGRGFFGAQW